MNGLQRLHEAGVSVWLDTLSRELLETGAFAELVRDYAVTGATSNPTIFARAITESDRYDDQLRSAFEAGASDPQDLFFELALEDVRRAAEVLRPVYEATSGDDGFVSFECTPDLADDVNATIAQALELWSRLGLPNVMIKVPATAAGVPAIEELTARGVNVNVTLLFSIDRYEQVMEAYLAGLERRALAGESLSPLASVASFFVSRVDAKADALLAPGSPLRGRVAIANAHRALRSLPRALRRRALGAPPPTGSEAPAPALGEHGHEGPLLPRRALRGGARRPGGDQHDAREDPARLCRPRQRRSRARRRRQGGGAGAQRRGGRRARPRGHDRGARTEGRRVLLRLLPRTARVHRAQAAGAGGIGAGGRCERLT